MAVSKKLRREKLTSPLPRGTTQRHWRVCSTVSVPRPSYASQVSRAYALDMYTDDYPRKSRQQTSAPPPVVDPLAIQAQEVRNQTAPVPVHLNDAVNAPKRTTSTLMPGVVGVGGSSRRKSQKEPVSDQGAVDPLLHVKVYVLADM